MKGWMLRFWIGMAGYIVLLSILWVGSGMILVWGVTNYLVGRRYR